METFAYVLGVVRSAYLVVGGQPCSQHFGPLGALERHGFAATSFNLKRLAYAWQDDVRP